MTDHAAAPSSIGMWTVYDHPKDYPNAYVARLWNGTVPASDVILCTDIDELRGILQKKGFVKLMRQKGDDPVIMEVWI